jgi:hypothetical protein
MVLVLPEIHGNIQLVAPSKNSTLHRDGNEIGERLHESKIALRDVDRERSSLSRSGDFPPLT